MRLLGMLVVVLGGAVVAGCAAQPGASAGPPATSSPPPAASAGTGSVPHGTWTMTLTEQDLVAAGFTDPGAAAENTGTFTFTIAPDGTWTIAQAASQPVKWPVFRGTYAVTGENIAEMQTTFPPEYAGDVVSMQLTEGSDGLAVKILSPDDPLLRLQFERHVWARSP